MSLRCVSSLRSSSIDWAADVIGVTHVGCVLYKQCHSYRAIYGCYLRRTAATPLRSLCSTSFEISVLMISRRALNVHTRKLRGFEGPFLNTRTRRLLSHGRWSRKIWPVLNTKHWIQTIIRPILLRVTMSALNSTFTAIVQFAWIYDHSNRQQNICLELLQLLWCSALRERDQIS